MSNLSEIAVSSIDVSKTASQKARRASMNGEGLKELTASIKEHGVLQPIILRTGKKGRHELVAGERRYMAAKAAGLKTVPAVVRELTDAQVIEVQLIENLQREDLHAMQEAEGYQQLMQKHGHPVEELHNRVGKSRSYVYGRIKLLALCQTARKAFYAGKVSASVALLIARIPVEKMQREALDRITDDWLPMTYRRAKDYIQQSFMLKLRGAPFSPADASLVKAAGACGACPKRTGNQPELFGDVKSTDVCTDPKCFNSKSKAAGNARIKAAKADDRETITGDAAKKIAPRGVNNHIYHHYVRASDTCYSDSKQRKYKVIVGNDVKPILLQCPETGAAIEVYKESTVQAALNKNKKKAAAAKGPSPEAAQRRKAMIEKKFRAEVYAQLRPKLNAPTVQAMAAFMYDQLGNDGQIAICKLHNYEPVEKKTSWGTKYKDWDGFLKVIEKMTRPKAVALINDCMYANQLQVNTWSSEKPARLLAAAKAAGLKLPAIRASVTPKKKTKKKAAKKTGHAKKSARKKAKKKVTKKRGNKK